MIGNGRKVSICVHKSPTGVPGGPGRGREASCFGTGGVWVSLPLPPEPAPSPSNLVEEDSFYTCVRACCGRACVLVSLRVACGESICGQLVCSCWCVVVLADSLLWIAFVGEFPVHSVLQ